MNWLRSWAIGFGLTLSLVGSSPQQDASDSIKIVSISPDPAVPLRVGQQASFKVEVEYTLTSADSGSVTLVIQQAESGRAPLSNESDVVLKGRARLVLSKDIEVPDTKAINVFTPLTVQGGTSTRVVSTRSYKVIKP